MSDENGAENNINTKKRQNDQIHRIEFNNKGPQVPKQHPDQFSFSSVLAAGRASIIDYIYAKPREYREIAVNDREYNKSRYSRCSNKVYTSKYTPFNIIPLFLVTKFTRFQNIFFLITGIVQLVYPHVPGSRFGILLPLSGIILIDFIKEVILERKLWKSDKIANTSPVCYVENGETKIKPCGDVEVGDILKVKCKEMFPADMIILSSSGNEGECYIETSNMDGEINLKIRRSHKGTATYNTPDALKTLKGTVITSLPSKNLNTFEGKLNVGPVTDGILDFSNTLLRGARLVKTDWVYGLVVYTGHETKTFLNNNKPVFKSTKMDQTLNMQIIGLFLGLYVLSMICSYKSAEFKDDNPINKVFLYENSSFVNHFFYNLPIFILLFNNIVPLSLLITCEMLKVILGRYISSDEELYYTPARKFAFSRSDWLLEDLGLVDNIFCDKTGTLTCNQIKFKAISAGDKLYTNTLDITTNGKADPLHKLIDLNKFKNTDGLEALAATVVLLCNEAMPMYGGDEHNKLEYITASIDEESLLNGSYFYNLVYASKANNIATIVHTENNVEIKFEVLAINAFSSYRRRMSAIVRAPNGKLYILVKGSDESVFSTLSPESRNSPMCDRIQKSLKSFMSEGYRVLCLSYAELSEEAYVGWHESHLKIVAAAPNSPQVQASFSKIECDLHIVGFTVSEDRLQDFVPETISMLSIAGIKTWILTGDGLETAINIAKACKFLHPKMPILECIGSIKNNVISSLEKATHEFRSMYPAPVVKLTPKQELIKKFSIRCNTFYNKFTRAVYNGFCHFLVFIRYKKKHEMLKCQYIYPYGKKRFPKQKFVGLVVTGSALEIILEDELASKLFLELAMECKSVVCCSMSPSQKARVVSLVSNNVKNSVTLAVGDGANDVGMIRAASIGVGISGLEGTHAAKCSDFVIYQFYHLAKLIIGHGARSYYSISSFVLYSFYKNIIIYTSQIWFQLYNGYSSESLYETWTSIASYNLVWIFTQPFVIGIYGRTVSTETLMRNPYLYRLGHKRMFYNQKLFYRMLLNSLITSCLVFYAWKLLYQYSNSILDREGKPLDAAYIGEMLFTNILIIVSVEVILYILKLTHIVALFSIGPVILFLCFFTIYTEYVPKFFDISTQLLGMSDMLSYRVFWIGVLLCTSLRLYFDIMYKYIRREFFTKKYHAFQKSIL